MWERVKNLWRWIKTRPLWAWAQVMRLLGWIKGLFPAETGWVFITYTCFLFSTFIALFLLITPILIREIWNFPSTLQELRDTNNALKSGAYLAFFGSLTATGALIGYAFSFLRVLNNERQTQAVEQGQITDRINKAVQNLGATRDGGGKNPNNIEMRIGAIYALERIIQDSSRDHIHILKILSAYIRENAPASDAVEIKGEETPSKPRIDIQTALTVIGTNAPKEDGGNWFVIDLRECNLQGVDLEDLDLNHARFENSKFQGANLSWAHLQRADLGGAQLQGAKLEWAQLQGASLEEAQLEEAGLSWAHLQGANLSWAHLQGANLSSAQLQGAHLYGAHLQGANLLQANLFDCRFLTQEQIDSAFGDASTTLPDDLTRPRHWPNWKLGFPKAYDEWKKWQNNPEAYKPPPKPEDGE